MPPLFRRHSNVQCFFCNSPVPLLQNPHSFRCSACGCWNRYNEKGEILSDEPAMHEEYLNHKSFAKRASPSKDQLPNAYRPGPFCHNCQTNHMLIVNLLSNYLPPPESPEYEQRLQMLPEYRESLHARYPPVCEVCKPIVEEEIQRKEQMARRKALGGWLKEGKDRQRRVSGTPPVKEKGVAKAFYWKIRGALWYLSSLISIVATSTAALGFHPFKQLPYFHLFLLPLVLLSLFWTAWDPTYVSVQNAQMQGRDVRVNGKINYIICQMAAWLSRTSISATLSLRWYNRNMDFLHVNDVVPERQRILFTTALIIELTALLASPLFLRLQHPPVIRLIDTQSHKPTSSRSATPSKVTRPTTPAAMESDLLASLTLSSKPVITPTNPVFGLPSLLSTVSAPATPEERLVDDDAMDWSPTRDGRASPIGRAGKHKQSRSQDDASWLRPQRFFAPEKPTGLETLFERTKLDENAMEIDGTRPEFSSYRQSKRKRWYIYVILPLAFVLPVVCYACKIWLGGSRSHRIGSIKQ